MRTQTKTAASECKKKTHTYYIIYVNKILKMKTLYVKLSSEYNRVAQLSFCNGIGMEQAKGFEKLFN